ncbi:MAG TPA: type IV pilin protein [Burkholderiaceae bacterium]|nr:type IV pilin protein [Burkholderiaceae bacterium]
MFFVGVDERFAACRAPWPLRRSLLKKSRVESVTSRDCWPRDCGVIALHNCIDSKLVTMLQTVVSRSARGFTLIEVLIVMTVLAILAAIAIPNYSRYITRGNLVEATNALSEYRVRMEQFYQDNRSYRNAGGDCGVAVPANLQNFALNCVIAAAGQAYTATATGAGSMAGFAYSINQANVRATTGLPAKWGALPADAATRWVTR